VASALRIPHKVDRVRSFKSDYLVFETAWLPLVGVTLRTYQFVPDRQPTAFLGFDVGFFSQQALIRELTEWAIEAEGRENYNRRLQVYANAGEQPEKLLRRSRTVAERYFGIKWTVMLFVNESVAERIPVDFGA